MQKALFWIRLRLMICGGLLSPSQRAELLALLRSGRTEQRVARRANAMLLLDDGWSSEKVAEALYLDDDTVRSWRKIYDQAGLAGLERFEGSGSASHLSKAQEETLIGRFATTPPRSTRQVGAFIEKEFGVVYESRSGLIALLHRLGLEYSKPETIGKQLDPKSSRRSSKPTRIS
ncbi:MAG TPA: helix-turn-helix domain-containing protein [Methylocystis sp.]|nr:helix-turn-helix domain-containing protein [Methylocystis sp.]